MNFHETVMGKAFLQGQVPKLIQALSQIAQALSSPRPAYLVQQKIPTDFLAELYHGNFDPSDVPESPGIADSNREISRFQENLRVDLPEAVWEQIEAYRDLLDARSILQSEQAFAAGFRCAATMLVAGLAAPSAAEPSAAGEGQQDDKQD